MKNFYGVHVHIIRIILNIKIFFWKKSLCLLQAFLYIQIFIILSQLHNITKIQRLRMLEKSRKPKQICETQLRSDNMKETDRYIKIKRLKIVFTMDECLTLCLVSIKPTGYI